jgi:predicted alpha/beta-fold hydrolase
MPIVDSKFDAPNFMQNGHFQTMYPFFFRKVDSVEYKRERVELDDGDFIDIDRIENDQFNELVILSHGLEGNSQTGYIKGMAKYLHQASQVDIVAWNMRSCSGELNRKGRFYHAASCDDLNQVIKYALTVKKYKKIHLVGFSLGGNLTAFYAAKYGNSEVDQVTSAAIFSSPIHLESTINKLKETSIGNFYAESFLTTMRKKALQKQRLGLLDVDPKDLRACKDFIDFDNLVTAPTHGFKDALDYYNEASASNIINDVRIPTLIVQSKDDPFLTRECFPIREAYRNPHLHLEITKTGGHIGFMTLEKGLNFWSEQRAAQFINTVA